MSELKTFLDTHKLDHNEKVFTLKDNTRVVCLAFDAYGIDDYRYYGYNRMLPQNIKSMFPENAYGIHGIIISPYDENSINEISRLARRDGHVLAYEKTNNEKTKETLRQYA